METLREPFRLVEPSDISYREACIRFEFLASMIAMDTEPAYLAYPWVGEFLLNRAWGYNSDGIASAIETELTETWPLLTAGAFNGDLSRAQAALTKLTDWRAKNRKW